MDIKFCILWKRTMSKKVAKNFKKSKLFFNFFSKKKNSKQKSTKSAICIRPVLGFFALGDKVENTILGENAVFEIHLAPDYCFGEISRASRKKWKKHEKKHRSRWGVFRQFFRNRKNSRWPPTKAYGRISHFPEFPDTCSFFRAEQCPKYFVLSFFLCPILTSKNVIWSVNSRGAMGGIVRYTFATFCVENVFFAKFLFIDPLRFHNPPPTTKTRFYNFYKRTLMSKSEKTCFLYIWV